ncbi:MAG: TPM domain-containing protein [Chitinophagales bacterium]
MNTGITIKRRTISNSFLMVLFCFSVLLSWAQNIPAKPDPPQPVNDFAGLLSADEAQQLDHKLRAYYDSTSTEIVIVTVPSLEGAPEAEYAATLGEKWGVGKKEKHNGVVILVSKNDRKGYIATGYGVEDGLNTNVCRRIYQKIMVPNFKAGNFYAGFDEATTAMFEVLSGKFQADEDDNEQADKIPLPVVIFLIIVVIILVIVLSRLGGGGGGTFSRRGWNRGPFWPGGGFGGGGFSSGGGGGGFGFGGGSFSGGGSGGSW